MGGQDGIRGYVYQTIISVIKSLQENQWDYMTIEPNTEFEKVDIIWEMSNGNIRCQQIKSSINNFSKSQIILWLEQMINDYPGADHYGIILVGNIKDEVSRFVTNLNNGNIDPSLSSILFNNVTKLEVDILIFNSSNLISTIRDSLSKYLSELGYHLPHNAISLISGGLIFQFLEFSIVGQKVGKDNFIYELNKWIRTNYNRSLNDSLEKSVIKVGSYFRSDRKILNQVSAGKFFLDHKLLTREITQNVISLCREIKTFNLPKRTEKQKTNPTSNNLTLLIESTFGIQDCDLDEDDILFIKDNLRKWYNINVKDCFYNVGNLSKQYSLEIWPGNFVSYIGTENEKKKWEKLQELIRVMKTLESLIIFCQYLSKHSFIELVVLNEGKQHDEDVIITLSIPDTVKILSPENMIIPNDYNALNFLLDIEISRLFEIEEDSFIKGYADRFYLDYKPYETLDQLYQVGYWSKRLENKRSHLISTIKNSLDFEMFDDTPGFIKIRFTFSKINPGIRIAFPCILLFNSDTSFNVEFEVKSKLNVTQEGNLSVVV